MILTFNCADTESLFPRNRVKRFANIETVARRKLNRLHAAVSLDFLRVPPGNNHEAQVGDRKGRHSIRINAQFRTIRRAYLDRVLFWNGVDLARKLDRFQIFYNVYRVHRSLDGVTPAQRAGAPASATAMLASYAWKQHCSDLFQTPVPA